MPRAAGLGKPSCRLGNSARHRRAGRGRPVEAVKVATGSKGRTPSRDTARLEATALAPVAGLTGAQGAPAIPPLPTIILPDFPRGSARPVEASGRRLATGWPRSTATARCCPALTRCGATIRAIRGKIRPYPTCAPIPARPSPRGPGPWPGPARHGWRFATMPTAWAAMATIRACPATAPGPGDVSGPMGAQALAQPAPSPPIPPGDSGTDGPKPLCRTKNARRAP